MPLTMAKMGEKVVIQRIGGQEENKRFLESLGFVPGSVITLITINGGNAIVQIKESRVAISKEVAKKIMIRNQM